MSSKPGPFFRLESGCWRVVSIVTEIGLVDRVAELLMLDGPGGAIIKVISGRPGVLDSNLGFCLYPTAPDIYICESEVWLVSRLCCHVTSGRVLANPCHSFTSLDPEILGAHW